MIVLSGSHTLRRQAILLRFPLWLQSRLNFVLSKPARCERGEHVRTGQRSATLPDVRPLQFTANQPREMPSGKVTCTAAMTAAVIGRNTKAGEGRAVRKGMVLCAFI